LILQILFGFKLVAEITVFILINDRVKVKTWPKIFFMNFSYTIKFVFTFSNR